MLIGMAMSILTTTLFYLIAAYTPTFGRAALHLDATGGTRRDLVHRASQISSGCRSAVRSPTGSAAIHCSC